MSIDRRALLRALPATLLPVTLITPGDASESARPLSDDRHLSTPAPAPDIATALAQLEAAMRGGGYAVEDWELHIRTTRRGWFVARDRDGNSLL